MNKLMKKRKEGDFCKNINNGYTIRSSVFGKFFIVIIFCLIAINAVFFEYFSLPGVEKISVGSGYELPPSHLGQMKAKIVDDAFMQGSAAPVMNAADRAITVISDNTVQCAEAGDYRLQFSLGGIIPVKSVELKVVEPVYVIPCGQSIGILLQTDGVTVVGHSPVLDEQGRALYPAKEAGLIMGDFITDINGTLITNDYQVAELINELGKVGETIKIKYTRNKQVMECQLEAVYCADTGSFRIGLYIRDNTAGVGTLTFYDPASGKYGALGHMISDLNDRGAAGDNKGSIVRANIQGIKSGTIGAPGEKMGVFVSSDWNGTIEKNSTFGIFGQIDSEPEGGHFAEAIPVAFSNEIETGAAEIYTVISGEQVEKYKINIVKILHNYRSSGKGLVIEITDERLLEQTGGIVQGMSGSPIVQNGKLVGAVTHVFINNPQKGYGCLAEWMIEEAGFPCY